MRLEAGDRVPDMLRALYGEEESQARIAMRSGIMKRITVRAVGIPRFITR